MDISISRLNNRMALQVPAELPLGLVFVVGQVARLQRSRDGKVVFFELVQGRHRLPCRLPGRVAREALLQEGDRVRAGGRLLFNPHLAGYLLVTRDVEVLPQRAAGSSLQSIIDDARSRQGQTQNTGPQAASPVQPELPTWVTRLAPPEVRRELDRQAEGEAEDGPGLDEPGAGSGEPSSEVDAVADMETDSPADATLSPAMVAFLSQAIDSNEDIELTAEMLSSHLPAAPGSERGDETAPQDEAPVRERKETPALSPDDLPFNLEQSTSEQPATPWRLDLPQLAALLLVIFLVAAALLLILTQT
ncbi:MAG: hypothetical protein ACOC9X_05280 [bacterium]